MSALDSLLAEIDNAEVKLTATQRRTIESIRIERTMNYDRTKIENEVIKERIRNAGSAVSYAITTRPVDSDGTLLEIIGREHRHILIGKRGGLTTYDVDDKGKTVTLRGWHECVRLGSWERREAGKAIRKQMKKEGLF